MNDIGFTTSTAELATNGSYITLGEFVAFFFIFNVGLIVAAVVLWRCTWYNLNKLKIWDIKVGREQIIGRDTPIRRFWEALHRIVKNLSSWEHNFLVAQCGFEAFAYIFFLRRMMHLMLVLTVTDLLVWIPYQLYFNPLSAFSLVSVDSGSNALFRTFYMLWVTGAVFYSLREMKRYLRLVLKHHLFREDRRLLNNLKTKTVFLRFIGENRRIDPLELRTRLVEQLKVEDTVLACLQLPSNSKHIALQYQYLIYKLVKEYGLEHFNRFWRFFKEADSAKKKQALEDRIKLLAMEPQDQTFNSYLVVFEHYRTAQSVVRDFSDTRSVFDLFPQDHGHSELSGFGDTTVHLWANWAQSPNDVCWVNVGVPEESITLKGLFMNILAILLIVLGVSLMVLARTRSIIDIPNILIPITLAIINSLLRFLLSKSSQWENRHFQYEWHIKEMKILVIFFTCNVLVASLVRDTLNLFDVLKTGWGWTQLLRLVYKRPDGLFYYNYILNEIGITTFTMLFRMGDLFIQVFEVDFTFEKNTRIRLKSKYGTNDPFRYGYYYALNIIVLAMVLMYSASTPLIHLVAFLYFYAHMYLYSYSLSVFHKEEETASYLRLLQAVCDHLLYFIIGVLFLIGITMLFEEQYAYGLIIYLWMGLILTLSLPDLGQKEGFLKDHTTDHELRSSDVPQHVVEWRQEYENSMRPVDMRVPL